MVLQMSGITRGVSKKRAVKEEKKMRMVARESIIGIENDEGLRALDGINVFEAEVESKEELINLFNERYPEFKADTIEVYGYDKI